MSISNQPDTRENSAVVVLANLMDQDGTLNAESTARADLAIKVFHEFKANLILTSGWAYRSDSETPIAQAMADYILSVLHLNPPPVIADPRARDTVGDAVFIRDQVQRLGLEEIFLVTSDYHSKRAELIFKAFLPDEFLISTFSAQTNPTELELLEREHAEKESLRVFQRMFSGICLKNLEQAERALVEKHPYYNGSEFPKFDFKLSPIL